MDWLHALSPGEFLATAFGFAVLTTLALQVVGTAALLWLFSLGGHE
jgi:hypothetical protein